MNNSVVYIIPGFKHSPNRKIYQDVANLFKKRGIDVVMVNVDWNYRTVSQWIDQFLTKYYKKDNRKKYFFGFSYGAVISFIAATKVDVDELILCSLSPYFNEDLPGLFKSWKKGIGKKRTEDFNKFKISQLAPLIKTKTFLLYGTKEGRFIETRAKDTYRRLKSEKYLIKVEGSKHDIGNTEYLSQIQKVVDKLK